MISHCLTAASGSGSQFRGRMGIYLAIIAAVTIISLTVISRFPQQDNVCTEIEILGMKFKQCENGEIEPTLTQEARETVTNTPSLPGETSVVREELEAATSNNVTSNPLQSIVGNWLASDQKQFSAAFSFGNDGKYSTIVNINSSWVPPIVGRYNFSLIQEQLSLQPYGSTSVAFTIVETTSESFTVTDPSGTKIIFARIPSR